MFGWKRTLHKTSTGKKQRALTLKSSLSTYIHVQKSNALVNKIHNSRCFDGLSVFNPSAYFTVATVTHQYKTTKYVFKI